MGSSSFDPQSLLNTFIGKRSIHLVSLLGAGAYGVVYLGVHVPTSRRYAVKLLTRTCAIEAEIALHSRVSGHTGIVTLDRVIREKNRVFLVLEYASSGDLFCAITKNEGIMGNNRAIRHIFLQIIDAVQHCHDQGIAHRDLKPENILVFSQLHVKLADFGLATTKLVSGEFNCGSSFYFSPECQGHFTNHKAYSTRQNDIWSLGVILVNLVAGRNPWRCASVQDVTFQQYVRRPCASFFKTLLPAISDELATLLTRIFCLDPARRISLPELRLHVAAIKTFAHSTHNRHHHRVHIATPVRMTTAPTKKQRQSSIRAPKVTLTHSLVYSLCDYIDGFSDDEDDSSSSSSATSSPPQTPPTSTTPSPSSSLSSLEFSPLPPPLPYKQPCYIPPCKTEHNGGNYYNYRSSTPQHRII